MVVMEDTKKYYRVLDLEPGASEEEINQAYKDLAFIWHPDRIPKDNERLQQKAIAKLQEINQAREHLRAIKQRNSQKNYTPPSTNPYPHSYAQSRYQASSERYSRAKSSEQQRSANTTTGQSQRTYTRQDYAAQTNGSTANAAQKNYTRQTYSQSTQPQTPPKAPSNYAQHTDDPLIGVNLQGQDLKERDFAKRNMSKANLSHCNLSDAFLHRVNLQDANLEKANLFRANLLEANLRQANLREANLIGSDLSGADLSGADLRGAKVGTSDRLLLKLTGTILTGTILPDGSVHS